MVVHYYAVDVFMINFSVLEMPYVSCIKHVINFNELQKVLCTTKSVLEI